MRKQQLWIFFTAAALSVSALGCETIKGAGKGFAKDVDILVGAFKGEEGNELVEADNWVKKHLW